MANTPNWQHHSAKTRGRRGVCKGVLRGRRQALQALLCRIGAAPATSTPAVHPAHNGGHQAAQP